MSTDEITISEYILARLVQLNVQSVFGVPGDFNLEFLDYIESSPKLDWVGNANELNAAYSADGYARVSKTLACLVTTFGVGELSALCGVAGMMSERLPLLHIVGVPSTKLQGKKALLHHTLGDGRFNEFETMSAQIAAHTARLLRAEGAAETIDELIKVAIRECRPVYLTLPTDLVHAKISKSSLETPLTKHVLNVLLSRYDAAKDPVVLVDACTSRFGMEGHVRQLVETTNMRFFETPMGKAVMDETHPNYGGCYIGANSLPAVQKLVEKSDLVLLMGGLPSDFNSGSFSQHLETGKTVEMHSDHVMIGFARYDGLSFRELLPLFIEQLKERPQKVGSTPANEQIEAAEDQRQEAVTVPDAAEQADEDDKWGKNAITQKYLWPRVSKFFKDNDVIIAETGTSAFGVLDIPYPKTAIALAQVLWGAIGWSVGAMFGAAVAARERKVEGRTILFVGDGSLQLTLQEIGTVLRKGLTPYIFVLNNDGYEIERQIHGVTAKYNDIQPYDHSLLLDFLAGPPKEGVPRKHKFTKVATRAELDSLLDDQEFASAGVCNLIEIMMPRGDAPRALLTQAKLTAEANAE